MSNLSVVRFVVASTSLQIGHLYRLADSLFWPEN